MIHFWSKYFDMDLRIFSCLNTLVSISHDWIWIKETIDNLSYYSQCAMVKIQSPLKKKIVLVITTNDYLNNKAKIQAVIMESGAL